MRKKVVFRFFIIFAVLIVCTVAIFMTHKHIQEQKRLSEKPFFTEFKLSEKELEYFASYYWIEVTPQLQNGLNQEDWPDFSYYTMQPTKETEMATVVLNYWLFDMEWECGVKEKKIIEEYGFSIDTPIEVNWIMTHPREALEIVSGVSISYQLKQHSYLENRYQEIVKLKEKEESVTETE